MKMERKEKSREQLKERYSLLIKAVRHVWEYVVSLPIIWSYRTLFLLSGKLHYPKEYKEFIFKRSDLARSRPFGISGFYRVKNEELFLASSIESHLPFLDEIVIVCGNSTDKTPHIAEEYKRRYPDKVKVYYYKPKVYPPFSKEHTGFPPSSPYSFVNYSNFALSKTTKSVAIKIDADHIAVAGKLKKITDAIRKKGLDTIIHFQGVNLYKQNNFYYVHEDIPLTTGFDCGLFRVSGGTHFVHRKDWEFFKVPLKMKLNRSWAGVLFYHLRGIKPDKGVSNYGKGTKMANQHMEEVRGSRMISWHEAVRKHAELREVSDPNSAEGIVRFFK